MLALRSVRVRLTFWYVVVLALILAAFSAGIYLTLRHNLYANLDDSVEARTNDLLAIVQLDGNQPTLAASVPAHDQEAGEQFVRVFNTSAAVTFDTSTAREVPADVAAVETALAGRTSTRSVKSGGTTYRVRTVPILQSDQIRGVLEVARSTGDVSDTLRTLLIILGVSYPATLALASFGGIFLAGRALSPIDSLTRLARRISAEDLGQRLDLQLPNDEVGRLARTFDEMIARLDAAFRRQRQFTADASHEMRTPLTAIKGQIEVALSKPREGAAYRDVLAGVNEEVDRLIRLVASLLTLARADAGEIPLASDAVNIGALIASAVEQVKPAARARQLDIAIEDGPNAVVHADEDLLLQLLLNLLDNAIKYTPAGGRVTAGWCAEGREALLWVSDTGVGIAPEHLDRVFDRFHRVDKARSRADGGAGLGLSISRWIAEAHGGSISATSSPGDGTTFTVRLPERP